MFKKFFIVLLFIIFTAGISLAFDSQNTHPDLSRTAIKVLEDKFGDKLNKAQENWIEQGSIAEDTDPRYLNHFYNPTSGKGLDDYAFYLGKVRHFTGLSAKDWAFDQDNIVGYTGDYSVKAILDSYRVGDYQRAYQGIGHIVHLVQDMAVPAHTRNDAHPAGDPFESWASLNGKINYDKLYYQNIDNIAQVFDELSNYSYNNFFSRDTVESSKLYNYKKLEKIIDDKKILYLINLIDNQEYKIAYIKNPDSIIATVEVGDDFFLNLDYWNMLYPKAVAYSAGTINWFLEEFDKIDEQRRQEKITALRFLNDLVAILKNTFEYEIGDKVLTVGDAGRSVWSGIASFFGKTKTYGGYFAESMKETSIVAADKTIDAANWLADKGKVLGISMDFNPSGEGVGIVGEGVSEAKAQEEAMGVARVIDGDTIELINGDIVRYIGIDTPELNQAGADDDECLAWVARIRNMNMLSSGDLKLIKDPGVDKDKYGRLLRYVYAGGVFINEALAREGLAEIFFCQPGWENCPVTADEARENKIKNAYEDAKANERGLFSEICKDGDQEDDNDSSLENNKKIPEEMSEEELDEEIKKVESYLHLLGGNSSGNPSQGDGEEDDPEEDEDIDTFLISYPPEISSSTSALFSLTSNASGASFEYCLNGSDCRSSSGELILENLSDFAYLIEVKACREEKCDESPIEYGWLIDTAPASSSITKIEEFDDGYQVFWSGEDAGDVASGVESYDVEYKMDKGDWLDWLKATTSLSELFKTDLEFGELCFRSRAYDNAGNRGEYGEQFCYTAPADLFPYFEYLNLSSLTSTSTSYTASTSVGLVYNIINQDLSLGYYYGEEGIEPSIDSSPWLSDPIDEFEFTNKTEGKKTVYTWIKYGDDLITQATSSSIILDKTPPTAPSLTSLYYKGGYYFTGSSTLSLSGTKELGVDVINFEDKKYLATSSEDTWLINSVSMDFICGQADNQARTGCIMEYCESNPDECSDQPKIYKRSAKIGACDEAGNCSDEQILNFKYDPALPTPFLIKEYHSLAYSGIFLIGMASDFAGEPFSYSSGIKEIYWQYSQNNGDWQGVELISKYFTEAGTDIYYFSGEENQNYTFQIRAEDNAGNFSAWSSENNIKADLSLGASYPVLSEVYGGGGNSGAYYKNDFVELYNPSDKNFSLDGWSIQYAAAAGASYDPVLLSGQISPYGYYLIKLHQGSGGEASVDNFDIEADINLSATNGKVALVENQEAIIGADDEDVIDFLGYGNANEKEGHLTASTLGNTISAERKAFVATNSSLMGSGGEYELSGNGWDTNENRDDWIMRDAPEPQWSGSPTEEVYRF